MPNDASDAFRQAPQEYEVLMVSHPTPMMPCAGPPELSMQLGQSGVHCNGLWYSLGDVRGMP